MAAISLSASASSSVSGMHHTFNAFFLPTAEVGSNNIDVNVLGDFPEDEAREFFTIVALEPELHSAVTNDAWAEIYQVWPLCRNKSPYCPCVHACPDTNVAPVLVRCLRLACKHICMSSKPVSQLCNPSPCPVTNCAYAMCNLSSTIEEMAKA